MQERSRVCPRAGGRASYRAALVAAAIVALAFASCEDVITPVVNEEVRVAQLPEYTLTILTPSNGTSSPLGANRVKDGEPLGLTAAPSGSFLFDYWMVTSGPGTVTFEDDHSASTVVRLSGGNATIIATFADTSAPTGGITIPDKILVDGVLYRTTKTINVELDATDNVAVTQMKLAESSFAVGTGSGWIAYDTTTNYTFASDGNKTLYVRFKDGDGNESNIYTATVKIDSTAPVPSRYQVELINRPGVYPTYVSTYNSNLQLNYLASDGTGSGMLKVYFSNTSTPPGLAQVNPYASTPVPYPWTLTSDQYAYGYYTVYFWFEDKLGNRSAPFTDQVRYDDKWEGDWGNNDIVAVSGATIIYDSYGVTQNLYNVYSPSWGDGKLVDPDYYKWGFYAHDSGSEYPAEIILDINAIISVAGDLPVVTFFDHNGDEVTPTGVTWPYLADNKKVRYTFSDLPFVDTGAYEYYFYMSVERAAAAPYATKPNYNITWYFDESGGM